jgi:mitochondrial cardiolipin hydrolase
MKPQQIRDMLAQTLQDRCLSRSERSALNQIFGHLDPTEQQLANYRSIAFDLARDAVDVTNSNLVLEWLEDVIKLLQQSTGDTRPASAEAFFSPSDDCPRRIRGLLARATQSVDICVFAITDDRLSSAILEAHRRGVRIRIITDDDKATDLGADATSLSNAGIDLRMDRSRYHMHHKFALFDRSQLLTGSYNWTRSAAENNEENFIITGDPRFIKPFSELFERLWQQFE